MIYYWKWWNHDATLAPIKNTNDIKLKKRKSIDFYFQDFLTSRFIFSYGTYIHINIWELVKMTCFNAKTSNKFGSFVNRKYHSRLKLCTFCYSFLCFNSMSNSSFVREAVTGCYVPHTQHDGLSESIFAFWNKW